MRLSDLIPGRRSRQAAVASYGAGSLLGIDPVTLRQPWQERARFHARRRGFVRQAYRFEAWQCGRGQLRIEHLEHGEWVPASQVEAPVPWAILGMYRSDLQDQAQTFRTQVFLNETIGEYMLQFQRRRDGAPGWTIRDPKVCQQVQVGAERGRWMIRNAPLGSTFLNTIEIVEDRHLLRHWMPDEEFHYLATSSMQGVIDDLETLYNLERDLDRRTRSSLIMSNGIWTHEEDHQLKVRLNQGTPAEREVSQLALDYAQASAKALNDTEDREVVSVAPRLWQTKHEPKVLEFKGHEKEILEFIQDRRVIIADSLPLATSSTLNSEQGVHWNEWQANDDDLIVLRTATEPNLVTITEGALWPILALCTDAGIWDGRLEEWRVGIDLDPVMRRPDNSKNVLAAFPYGAVGFRGLRQALHIPESDAPSAAELEIILAMLKAKAPAVPGMSVGDDTGAPTGPGDAVPSGSDGGKPPDPDAADAPPATTAAAPVLLDDSWLLTPASPN